MRKVFLIFLIILGFSAYADDEAIEDLALDFTTDSEIVAQVAKDEDVSSFLKWSADGVARRAKSFLDVIRDYGPEFPAVPLEFRALHSRCQSLRKDYNNEDAVSRRLKRVMYRQCGSFNDLATELGYENLAFSCRMFQ